MITYNVEEQAYVTDQNSTDYEIMEECVHKSEYLWSNLTQWYSSIVSYLVPSLVLVVSYIKILHFMALKTKNLALSSVINFFKQKKSN